MDTKQKKRTPVRSAAAGKKPRPAAKKPVKKTEKEAVPVKKAAPKRRPPKRTPVQKPKPAEYTAPLPEVVYTPAKPFNRGRFLLHLATVVAVVLALSFGISIFFKVEIVTVAGSQKYDPWTVKEASGIEIGDNLLSFGKAKAAGKIKTTLPYVDTVRIGIKLPDTVNIEIKELDVVYGIQDAGTQWWLITSSGRVVDKVDRATAELNTCISGVSLASPVIGQQAVAHEEHSKTPATGEGEEGATTATTVPITVTDSDRLETALTILQYLEECGIIGDAASINVADLGNLELWWTGKRFQVKLGDTTQLLYKIKCMNAAINGKDEANSLKEYDSGVLDISFTIKPDDIIYQTFE